MGVRLELAGVTVLVATLAMHCTAGRFECQTDEQCNDGMCSPEGWCAFEDDECPSGWSYGVHAGGGLAGECVPEDGTSGPGVTADPSATTSPATTVQPVTTADPSTTGSTTDEPGTETGTVGSCGDGVVDDAEGCDDGNDEDGDGCDTDCTPSGETLWVEVVGEPGNVDAFRDVAVRSSGDIFVAGDFDERPTVARYDVDGTSFGAMAIEDTETGHAWGIDAVDAVVAVGGRLSDDTGFVAWMTEEGASSFATTGAIYDVALYEAGITTVWVVGARDGAPWGGLHDEDGGAVIELTDLEFPGPGTAWGVIIHEEQLYMVGTSADGGQPWLQHRDSFGGQQWEEPLDVGDAGSAYGVGATADGDILVTGQVGTRDASEGFLVALDSAGGTLWSTRLTPDAGEFANIHKAAGGPSGEVVAIGWIATGATSADIWIGKYDSEGVLIWERTFAGEGAGQSSGYGVAIHEDGTITAVGAIANDDDDAWIAHLEP